MTETREEHEEPNPEESPFQVPPIEGMPYARGSEEDKAIEAILEEAERRKQRAPS